MIYTKRLFQVGFLREEIKGVLDKNSYRIRREQQASSLS